VKVKVKVKVSKKRRKDPCGAEGEEKRDNRRGLVASVHTHLEFITALLFYHFPSQVNAFLPVNPEKKPVSAP